MDNIKERPKWLTYSAVVISISALPFLGIWAGIWGILLVEPFVLVITFFVVIAIDQNRTNRNHKILALMESQGETERITRENSARELQEKDDREFQNEQQRLQNEQQRLQEAQQLKSRLTLLKNYETARKYEEAASICDELEMWEKAGELRRMAKTSFLISTNFSMGKNGTISLECPTCGSTQTAESKSNLVKCKHCGNNYLIPKKVLDMM